MVAGERPRPHGAVQALSCQLPASARGDETGDRAKDCAGGQASRENGIGFTDSMVQWEPSAPSGS
jgi:hypothetical protein